MFVNHLSRWRCDISRKYFTNGSFDIKQRIPDKCNFCSLCNIILFVSAVWGCVVKFPVSHRITLFLLHSQRLRRTTWESTNVCFCNIHLRLLRRNEKKNRDIEEQATEPISIDKFPSTQFTSENTNNNYPQTFYDTHITRYIRKSVILCSHVMSHHFQCWVRSIPNIFRYIYTFTITSLTAYI